MDHKKICCTCKLELDITSFSLRHLEHGRLSKDGLQRQCRKCQRAGQNAYYARNAEYKSKVKKSAIEIKTEKKRKVFAIKASNPYLHCGESDPVVLCFDHIDPKTKFSEISTMVGRGYSWDLIEKEMAKCQILCLNCHARKTAKMKDWANTNKEQCD